MHKKHLVSIVLSMLIRYKGAYDLIFLETWPEIDIPAKHEQYG